MHFKIIPADSLTEYLNRKDVLIIDLRERSAYRQGHIPHAVWMDWETIEDELHNRADTSSPYDLTYRWLILYCDYGNISLITARDLARIGYPVISLNGGFHEWNGPVEKEAPAAEIYSL